MLVILTLLHSTVVESQMVFLCVLVTSWKSITIAVKKVSFAFSLKTLMTVFIFKSNIPLIYSQKYDQILEKTQLSLYIIHDQYLFMYFELNCCLHRSMGCSSHVLFHRYSSQHCRIYRSHI